MELDIDRLAAEGVVLGLERPSGRNRIVIGPSQRVSGQIASDEGGTFIEARGAGTLALRELVWQLAAGALVVRAALDANEVRVELSVPRGEAATSGQIAVGRAACAELRLEHPAIAGGAIVAEQLEVRGLSLTLDDRGTRVTIEEVRLSGIALPLSDALLRFHEVVLKELVVTVPASGPLEVALSELHCGSLSAPLGESELAVAGLALQGGARFGAAGMHAVRMAARAVRLALPLGESAEERPSPRSARPPFDFTFLDRLRGRIVADVVTDLRLPIIRTRRATHAIRLEVRDGMISYERLEKGLAPLEDAVLDFALRGGRLVLEKDIPLIPFDRRTLVSFTLEGDEQRLAKEGWVRLARLAEPRVEIATSAAKGDDEEPGMIREIRLEGIDIDLALAPHPSLTFGGGTRLRLHGQETSGAFETLRIRGGVSYRPGGVAEPQRLEAEAERIAIGLEDFPLGERRANVGMLRVARVLHAHLALRGIVPARLDTHLETVELEDIRITAAGT